MIFLLLSLLNSNQVFAEPSSRSKNINFEDEVVEGINRKPLDAFNQISEQDAKKKNHLYLKRAGFQDRNDSLLTEMRLKP